MLQPIKGGKNLSDHQHKKPFQKKKPNQSHQDILRATCVTKWHDKYTYPARSLNVYTLTNP